MEELKTLFEELFHIDLVQAVWSNPRGAKSQEAAADTLSGKGTPAASGFVKVKVKVRPVELKGALYFQFESFTKTQAFHENLSAGEAVQKMCAQSGQTAASATGGLRSHNKAKNYILREGIPVPFLVDLGVMTREGRIVHAKSDKFRQMNRFLEFIEDILPQLATDRELTILDFGCGKSYLTFAMYYYLHELKGYDIRIIGLDLKRDVIAHCSALAQKYGYEKLTFLTGDIADYEGVSEVDMVVTLHACDTATDHALAKAVGWNAQVILSVPCCQHELNRQVKNEMLAPVLDYGLLKERFAALLTDGLRAKYLESMGYETQVLEFIDMEHTPKNILLRAVKSRKMNSVRVRKCREQIRACEETFGVRPTLGELL